jgi:HSP20 family protein
MNVRDLVPWGRNDRENAMVGNEPANPIMTLHREMNRMFDDMLRSFDAPLGAVGRFSGPSLEVEEADDHYRVTAELPGLSQDDVEVAWQDGRLRIRGEKRGEQRSGRSVSERWFGRFERQVSLPDVDDARAQAVFRDGLLTITLPKSQRAMENIRRIPINDQATTH